MCNNTQKLEFNSTNKNQISKTKKGNLLYRDSETKSINCCLCGKRIESTPNGWIYGNNPHPLMKHHSDRCCDSCNEIYVLPTRRYLYLSRNSKDFKKAINSKGWVNNVEGTKQFVALLSNI